MTPRITTLVAGPVLTAVLATGLVAGSVPTAPPATAGTATSPPTTAGTTRTAAVRPLPELMHIPAGQTQLITVQAAAWGRRDARLEMWQKRSGRWVRVGAAAARLGSRGLIPGPKRRQNTNTTPSGRYSLPMAFGRLGPAGYRIPYRPITAKSYWCLDNRSRFYNRWVEQYPMTVCRAGESERLIKRATYRRAVQIGYNLKQVRYRGGAIFLHDHGRGYTAGCVSVDRASMDRISRWLRREARPTIVIGTRASIIANR